MHKYQVRTPADALAYITDCTLATVCDMAGKKRRPKHEFERQMAIAQTAITWMQEMGVDVSTTRAEDVISAGSVQKWAEKYMPNGEVRGASRPAGEASSREAATSTVVLEGKETP